MKNSVITAHHWEIENATHSQILENSTSCKYQQNTLIQQDYWLKSHLLLCKIQAI